MTAFLLALLEGNGGESVANLGEEDGEPGDLPGGFSLGKSYCQRCDRCDQLRGIHENHPLPIEYAGKGEAAFPDETGSRSGRVKSIPAAWI